MQIAFSDRPNETLNQDFLGPFSENLSLFSEVNKKFSAFQKHKLAGLLQRVSQIRVGGSVGRAVASDRIL